ncbi:MAG TPA: class III signal peptide-containing protein [Candidatus Diapherotrites archaeon]|jgi:uncharacterized protein (UPF0333 family)|nr:class III signal peptide-containing protein [Candidatus Diapherotrites archaeon]
MKLKELLKDKKGQVSLEVLLIVGIVVLAALLVGYYLKQTAMNHNTTIFGYLKKVISGTN